jgi:FixJ family two-component response regulator
MPQITRRSTLMNDTQAAHLIDDDSTDDERAKALEVRKKFATLTRRERQVVQQVLDGRRNEQIAATLGIATRIVKLHRTSIRKKLGIRSVVQLATLADDARFFQPIPMAVASEQRPHRP